jgi:AraC-like DNA-binding protein
MWNTFKGGLASGQLRRVVEYVEEHLAEPLGLAELAALTVLSTHHFGEAFKKSIGTSPRRYVMERRVQFAHRLLRDNTRPIDNRRDRLCGRVLEPKPSDDEFPAGDRDHAGAVPAIARLTSIWSQLGGGTEWTLNSGN